MNEIKNTTLIFPILHYRVPIRDGRPARWEPSPRGEHIGPTLAPEAILFESPCRAHSETKIAQIICQGKDFNQLFYYS